MSKSDQPNPVSLPVLLVYGKSSSPDLPQASWFRVDDRPTVNTAAQNLKLSVLEILTETERALLVGVHEGVLKGNGRMIVGTVSPEVYKRIEDYRAKAPSTAKVPQATTTNSKPPSEQTTNNNERAAASMPSDPWDALRVGSLVAAKYWGPSGEAEGWWVAKVTAINGKDFTLSWLDEPDTSPLKAERKHVAILHPSFDAKREWDRKR